MAVATACSLSADERRGEDDSVRTDDAAGTRERRVARAPRPVGDRDENPVLDRADGHEVLGEHGHRARPAHRHRDHLGAGQRERPADLGEPEVVADRHAEAAEGRVDHGTDAIPRSHEAVGGEHREVRLAREGHVTVGTEHRRGVVQRFAGTLEESHDDRRTSPRRQLVELPELGIAGVDGGRGRGGAVGEQVSSQRALREHQQLRPGRRGVFERTSAQVGVDREVAVVHSQLSDRDRHHR